MTEKKKLTLVKGGGQNATGPPKVERRVVMPSVKHPGKVVLRLYIDRPPFVVDTLVDESELK